MYVCMPSEFQTRSSEIGRTASSRSKTGDRRGVAPIAHIEHLKRRSPCANLYGTLLDSLRFIDMYYIIMTYE